MKSTAVTDEFATFTIETKLNHHRQVKTSNKSKAKWIEQNCEIEICGRKIEKGFFYCGGALSALNGYDTEPSLVDETLPAEPSHVNMNYEDDSLGYYPNYQSLSPKCRGIYLDWLASDRNDQDIPIGYVFIYFYGLESRVLRAFETDATISDNEFIAIFDELSRLQAIFEHNRSFKYYSTNLLDLMSLKKPALIKPNKYKRSLLESETLFKLKLASQVAQGEPINAHLAYAWLKFSPEYTMKTPARRCQKEFQALFFHRYQEKFDKGIIVKPNKTPLSLYYRSASSSIGSVDVCPEALPDPSVLKAPINKISPIADACIDELSSYSRYLGRAGSSRKDAQAIALIPQKIIQYLNVPIVTNLQTWATQTIDEKKGVTSVKEFWQQIGTDTPKAINKKQKQTMSQLAEKLGFGIAPDIRLHQSAMQPEDKLIVFSPSLPSGFEPQDSFHIAVLMLRLGIMVALVDGDIDKSEVTMLSNYIREHRSLERLEKHYLIAYLRWLMHTPADMKGVKAKVDKLDDHNKASIKRFLIKISLADGKIDPAEVKKLEKIYRSLGFDKAQAIKDLHESAAYNVAAQNKDRVKTAESENKTKIDDIESLLDLNTLKALEAQTVDAQSILHDIFEDDEPHEEALETTQTVEPASEGIALDVNAKALFEKLITKPEWVIEDVVNLCQTLDIMMDGTIEAINDWAYEQVDAPVIEDDDKIYIDMEIVTELVG